MKIAEGAQRLLGLRAEAGPGLARAASPGRLQPELDLPMQPLGQLRPLRRQVVFLSRILGEVEQLEVMARRRGVLNELEGRQADAGDEAVLDDGSIQIVRPVRLA